MSVRKNKSFKMVKEILKFVCVAVFVTASVKCDEYPPKELIEMLKPMHDYCVADAEVTEEAVQNYDITNKDHKIMCYMACIMKQSNWMSTTGEIKYDFIINNPWEPIRDIIVTNVNKCRDIEVLDDECEYIYNFAVCLHRVDEEHWFLP